MGERHTAEKQSGDVLSKNVSLLANHSVVVAYFEVTLADDFAGEDIQHWKESQWKQGSHAVRHYFGDPIHRQQEDGVGASCLLEHIVSVTEDAMPSTKMRPTVVWMRSGSGSRISGVAKRVSRRQERFREGNITCALRTKRNERANDLYAMCIDA